MLRANAAPKKAITSVDQLVGGYLAISSTYDYVSGSCVERDYPVNSPVASVTKINDTTIGIRGIFQGSFYDKVIKATVNLSEGTFSIADGQVIYTSEDYGDVLLEECFYRRCSLLE